MPAKTKTTKAKATKAKATKGKGKKAAATVVAAVETPVVATPAPKEAPAATPAAAPATIEGVLESVRADFQALYADLAEQRTRISAMQQAARALEKQCIRELKAASKRTRRARDPNAPKRAPSGITKETSISKELATFLGVSAGTKLARVEVTRRINEYINENKLQNPEQRRQIIPDTKLAKLLGTTKKDEVTYFNLQTFLKHHYVKNA